MSLQGILKAEIHQYDKVLSAVTASTTASSLHKCPRSVGERRQQVHTSV